MQHPLIESVDAAATVIASHNPARLLLVVDQAAYDASGAKSALEPLFQRIKTSRFTGFRPNPKLEDVQRGIAQYRESKPDFIVALGGGTAIDLAKLIGGFAVQPGTAEELATGGAAIKVTGKPTMAIPTTAGTGSEATHFAVVYVQGKKYSVAHSALLPAYAVVDPKLTMSLPSQITAATGLDAFCQAVESIWAVGATDESIGYATKAARLAFDNLATATHEPTFRGREAMCRASHLAGKAINITKTTAPHALSYALTSRYGVPHGAAVALTLAPMLAFNSKVTDEDCVDPRGATAVRERMQQILVALKASSVSEACDLIGGLVSQINCPVTLDAVGVTTFGELVEVVDSVNAERLSNNPRRVERKQLLDVLGSIHPSIQGTHS